MCAWNLGGLIVAVITARSDVGLLKELLVPHERLLTLWPPDLLTSCSDSGATPARLRVGALLAVVV
jgi:hypothetical protein